MTTSANMKLSIPTIGADNDPAWQSELVASLNRVDQHTHDGATFGVKIPFNNLNFTASTPNFGTNPVTGVTWLQLTQTSAGPGATTSKGALWVDTSGNLWYTSTTANIKISSNTALQNGGTATNGFTGTEYQVTGGNASYTAASASTFYAPGYQAAKTYLPNIFTFVTGTGGVATSSTPANLAGSTIYAIGNSGPGFYIYDTGAAVAAGGGGTGAIPVLGYALALKSLGNVSAWNTFQFGFQGQLTNNTATSGNAVMTAWATALTPAYTGGTLSGSGKLQWQHVFNGSFTDASVNAASGIGYYFINYSDNAAASTPQLHTEYYQYPITTATGLLRSTATSASGLGYGAAFRYWLPKAAQGGNAPVATSSATPAAVSSYYWTDTTNLNAAWRLQLNSVNGGPVVGSSAGVALDVGYSPGGASSIQGVFGDILSTYTTALGSTQGFVFKGVVYHTSNLSALTDNSVSLGSSSFRYAFLYANQITPASTLTVNGNLTVTGNLSASSSGTQTVASVVPTASWSAGNGFGLYTNARTVAAGQWIGTDASGGGSPTLSSNTGQNVSAVVLSDGTLHGKKYVAATITYQTAIPSNSVVLANISSYTVSGDADAVVVLQATTNTTAATVYIANATGTTYPTAFTVAYQVVQVA